MRAFRGLGNAKLDDYAVSAFLPADQVAVRQNARHGDGKIGAFRAAEVRAAEVRAAEVRAAEVRVAEIRAAEVRAAEIRVAEVRAAEVRAAEVRAAEVRAAEVRAALNGPLDRKTTLDARQFIGRAGNLCGALNV